MVEVVDSCLRVKHPSCDVAFRQNSLTTSLWAVFVVDDQ